MKRSQGGRNVGQKVYWILVTLWMGFRGVPNSKISYKINPKQTGTGTRIYFRDATEADMKYGDLGPTPWALNNQS